MNWDRFIEWLMGTSNKKSKMPLNIILLMILALLYVIFS